MKLSDHDLQQIDPDWLRARIPEELLHVSQKLLSDLKEARERLNRNFTNSCVPPGSQPPWFHPAEDTETEEDDIPIPPPPDNKDDNGKSSTEKANTNSGKEPTAANPRKAQRNPGKQAGAPGFGHTQVLPITGTEHHQACHCAACGKAFTSETPVRAYTGFYTVDIEYGEPDKPGIQVVNTLHRYYATNCECGHTTRAVPHREPPEPLLDGIQLSEWRLSGSTLMSLIVFLSMRMRMSRPRIREFLLVWLGIELSTGTINQCIHEAGCSVAPVEEQLVEELLASDLPHADETTWLIAGKPFWLWTFVTATVTLYYTSTSSVHRITFRTNELVRNLLCEFKGWLMRCAELVEASDGYQVYREITKRISGTQNA